MITLQRPESLADALRWLGGPHAPRAVPVGGGTVLQPSADDPADLCLVDVTRLPQAQGITVEPGGDLRIGAAVRLERLRADACVQARAPLLAAACRTLGGLPVRHLATLGGNIGWRHGDTLPALLALQAHVEIVPLQGASPEPAGLALRGMSLVDCLALPRMPLILAVRVPGAGSGALSAARWQVFEKIGWRAAFSPSRLAIAAARRSARGDNAARAWCVAAVGATLSARRLVATETLCGALAAGDRSDASMERLREACLEDLQGDASLARLAARWLRGQFDVARSLEAR